MNALMTVGFLNAYRLCHCVSEFNTIGKYIFGQSWFAGDVPMPFSAEALRLSEVNVLYSSQSVLGCHPVRRPS